MVGVLIYANSFNVPFQYDDKFLIEYNPVLRDLNYFFHPASAVDGRFGGKEKAVISLLTAFLFAAHPVQTEAITYIMARFASLAALFYLLSMNLFMLFLSARNRKSGFLRESLYYGLMLICFTVDLKTKEHVGTFPVVALIRAQQAGQPRH